ncbi:hypothetical protein Tco_0241911 [Tanacetum coccineum]
MILIKHPTRLNDPLRIVQGVKTQLMVRIVEDVLFYERNLRKICLHIVLKLAFPSLQDISESSYDNTKRCSCSIKKPFPLSTDAEAIQADCDIKAINIILQGLPTEIYALVSQHRVAKDLWEKIKLLMQGTSLTKQERECKLYDEFDKFTYKKGETLHEYYLRFTLLLNDMNIYKMPLEQFQVNTKFLNTLPDEWSKFVTDVKLFKSLDGQYTQCVLSADDLDAYESDCDELNSAKIALMANLFQGMAQMH